MSYAKLIRWSGLVGLLAGGLTVLFNLALIAGIVSPAVDNPRVMGTILLTIFALIGFYAYQHARAGLLGLLGFVITVMALVVNVSFRYVAIFVVPVLQAQYPDALKAVSQGPITVFISVIFLLFVVGYVLFGIATLRADMLPRWTAWLLIVGPVVNYLGMMIPLASPLGSVLIGVGIAGMGYELWAGPRWRVAAPEPQPAL